ncbi:MAG: MFS transporter [Candidatus Bathyarchaeia archaeon]
MDTDEKPTEVMAVGSWRSAVYLCAFATQMSFNITLLAVPIYALRLGASDLLIGVIGAVGGVTYASAARFFGAVSDRFSRRLLISVALGVQAAACLLFSFIDAAGLLAFARFLQAAGAGLFWPVIEALVADLAPEERLDKSLRGYNLGWGIGSIIGPQVGGLLISLISIKAPFYFSAATCLAMIPVTASTRTPRRNPSRPQLSQASGEKTVKVRASRRVYAALISGVLFSFNGGIVATLFPAFATRLEVPPYTIGMLFLLSGLTQTAVFAQADGVAAKLGLKASLLAGSSIFSLSLLVIPFTSSLSVYIASFAGQGVALGLLYATSLSLILRESGAQHGKAAGMWESTLGAGFFIGPLIGGALADASETAPYLLGASASALMAALQFRLLHRDSET